MNQEISRLEEQYKTLLMQRLTPDGRLAVSCPDFRYPAPLFVYVKSVKTEKTIAVRLDGVDKTMRFWDYVDDDYSEEDGVWSEMSEEGLDKFVRKLYKVMDKAFDIEFFDADGECEDYLSGVAGFDFTAENACKAVKKAGKGVDFVIAKFSSFFGDTEYAFDKAFRQINLKK